MMMSIKVNKYFIINIFMLAYVCTCAKRKYGLVRVIKCLALQSV